MDGATTSSYFEAINKHVIPTSCNFDLFTLNFDSRRIVDSFCWI